MATKKTSKRAKHLMKAKKLEATMTLSKADAASPKLFNNCCSGAHYQTVSL